MMAGNQEPPRKMGLSLYANLLDNDNSGATISGAPVTYKAAEQSSEQDEAAKRQQAIAASLRFQPTKRPQLAAQKAKAKAIANKLAGIPSAPGPVEVKQDAPVEGPQIAAPKLSAADWVATVSEDEDANAYYASTRQRAGRKKRKKNNNNHKDTNTEFSHDWDDIYDPSRPNNYEDYKHSEEKIREVREWKDLLYRHRMKTRRSSDYDSDRSEQRPMNKQFAPPPMSFAPPANLNDDIPPPPPSTSLPDDPTGDDAYQRRLRMSLAQPPPPPPPPAPVAAIIPSPTGQIARPPVRYNLPPPPPDLAPPEADPTPDQESEVAEDQPRSNRPGQKGFAERLLSKYGWTKGSGLGAQGTGIINPLYAKADKRKKKSDADGGGFATPANTGRILGGNRSKEAKDREEGKFGAMSEVVKLENMLNGMDVQAELSKTDEDGSGGLMQEIGEEMGEKYGSVERLFIHIPEDDTDNDAVVFVRFVSQLSALRAVNALEGRIFNGNAIRARFWEREKFDEGIYV